MTISVPPKSPAAGFERRAARAELLAAQAGAGQEPLQFAAALCREQSTAALAIEQAHLAQPLTGRFVDDAARVVTLLAPLLRVAAERGPEALASEARTRMGEEAAVTSGRLLALWGGDSSARDDYLSRAMLRPYAEVLRAHGLSSDRLHRQGHCPFCGAAPAVGARKEMPDSNAAARVLCCALCGCEWNVSRAACPSCGETDPAKLPIFSSDAHPSVRIEACETCSRYVKTVDLTRDARMIPEIDELVSLSMDLWALDEGLSRIEPGLAGI